jgi:hypothetical protein
MRASFPPNEIRWGGAGLALGAVLYMIAIVLFVAVYGQPEGTGPGGRLVLADTAAHMRERWSLVHGLWCTEMMGALLIGLAAFALQRRRPTGFPLLPASVAWIAVGVGASILTVMYAFTLGSYPPALAAFQEQAAVFAALRGGMASLFYIGMAVMFFGLAGAFVAEMSAAKRILPRWVAFVGAAVTVLVTIRWVAMFAGILGGLTAASAPLGLVAFLLTGVFGLSILRGAPQDNTPG